MTVFAILAPILVFGVIIFIHELGHFLAAKSVGVYTPRFSIGFGPTLWSRRSGETEYVIGALPLGGYVRMASRLDEDIGGLEGGDENAARLDANDPDFDPNAMVPFGPKAVPESRLFENKPLWARIFILLAGVAMNAVLALVVMTIVVWHVGETRVPVTEVGMVRSLAGAPALAAIHPGDTVVAVNGKHVTSWDDVVDGIQQSGSTVTFTTNRATVPVSLGTGGVNRDSLSAALEFHQSPVIDSVVAGSPADQAGLRHGDRIVAVDGKPTFDWTDVVTLIRASPGRALALTVARGGATQQVTVTPRLEPPDDPTASDQTPVARIGASCVLPIVNERVGGLTAIRTGSRATWHYVTETVAFLGRMVSGGVTVRALGGPVAIVRASYQAAESGFDELLALIAFLSINVAIFNLLPIPIMDGGQVLLNVVESARGKPVTLRTRERLAQIGLAAVGVLLVIVMYNDTHTWFSGAFQWVTHLFS